MITPYVALNGRRLTGGQRTHLTRLQRRLKQKLDRMLKEIGDAGLEIGLLENAQQYDNGTPVAYIGAIHQFGVGKQPSRPWLSTPVEKHTEEWTRMVVRALEVDSNTEIHPEPVMRELGRRIVDRIVEDVESGNAELKANKTSTIDRKGGSVPMLDTGHLLSQLDYKVKGV